MKKETSLLISSSIAATVGGTEGAEGAEGGLGVLPPFLLPVCVRSGALLEAWMLDLSDGTGREAKDCWLASKVWAEEAMSSRRDVAASSLWIKVVSGLLSVAVMEMWDEVVLLLRCLGLARLADMVMLITMREHEEVGNCTS